jgi:kynurenine 3-monooxygenase
MRSCLLWTRYEFGFEDISILNEMMEKYGDWEMIFLNTKNVKSNADAIAELSYRNFMEMSSKTADDKFLQKKIEKWFSDKHPDKWIPLYSRSHLVTVLMLKL